MTGIHWYTEATSLRSFRSTTNSKGESTIVITLAVDEPMQLGHLLSDLKEIQRAQGAATKATQKRKKSGGAQLALPKPAGFLTYGDGT